MNLRFLNSGFSRRRAILLLGVLLAGIVLARWLRRCVVSLPYRRRWERALADSLGAASAHHVMELAGMRYRQLLSPRVCPRHLVLVYHLRWQILPALALYTALREHGLAPSQALQEVERLGWLEIGPWYRRSTVWLKGLPDPFPIWRMLVRAAMRTIFPPAGWRTVPARDDAQCYGFDVVGCWYHETLTRLGAPELTAVFCRMDDYLAGLVPASIGWSRQGTIGTGAERCDFRWCRRYAEILKTGPSRQTS
ncbi:MAG: L-2-amino-thiazoline-4-carboxylic acid hydrolase [Anaerolineae bacterium]